MTASVKPKYGLLHHPSLAFTNSCTCAGFALPLLAFITCPTIALRAFFVARFKLLNGFGVVRQHLVHHRFNRARVGDLYQAVFVDNLLNRGFGFRPHRFKCFFRQLAAECAVGDFAHQRGEARSGNRAVGKFPCLLCSA